MKPQINKLQQVNNLAQGYSVHYKEIQIISLSRKIYIIFTYRLMKLRLKRTQSQEYRKHPLHQS